MLTDADRELITAAVDGALDDRAEPAFRALLAESAEAAALFSQLQAHARRLRELRRMPAPAGLAAGVADRVRTETRAVPSTHHRRAAAARPGWALFAVAASLFLAVAAGSFWYVAQNGSNSEAVAHRKALPNPSPSTGNEYAVVPVAKPVEVAAAPREAGDREAVAVAPRELGPEAAPLPRSVNADVVGSPLVAVPEAFTTIEVRLPLRANVADLDQAEWKARVAAELARDPAYRLDLFVHDTLRAAEVFQAAAQAAGVKLTVDAVSQERIKKKLPTTWVVYTEALTPDEAAAFLARLAAQTRSADATPVFASAHLFPAQGTEQRDVRELLSVDLGLTKRPKAGGPKSVASGTADQVTSALQKGEKPAILVSYHPTNARMSPLVSKDVKNYVETRGERKPNAVPLVIVIRPVS
jgi:hypothetical protein